MRTVALCAILGLGMSRSVPPQELKLRDSYPADCEGEGVVIDLSEVSVVHRRALKYAAGAKIAKELRWGGTNPLIFIATTDDPSGQILHFGNGTMNEFSISRVKNREQANYGFRYWKVTGGAEGISKRDLMRYRDETQINFAVAELPLNLDECGDDLCTHEIPIGSSADVVCGRILPRETLAHLLRTKTTKHNSFLGVTPPPLTPPPKLRVPRAVADAIRQIKNAQATL